MQDAGLRAAGVSCEACPSGTPGRFGPGMPLSPRSQSFPRPAGGDFFQTTSSARRGQHFPERVEGNLQHQQRDDRPLAQVRMIPSKFIGFHDELMYAMSGRRTWR